MPHNLANPLEFLFSRFALQPETIALIGEKQKVSYSELLTAVRFWQTKAQTDWELTSGTVVGLLGDFNPTSLALLLGLIDMGCIVAPLAPKPLSQLDMMADVGQFEAWIKVEFASHPNSPPQGERGQVLNEVVFERTSVLATHHLYKGLKRSGEPGLVLFSSGSTGTPKGAVHNALPLLEKFKTVRAAKTTLCFLMFDHIGGINTVLHTLSNGVTLVTVSNRDPQTVCRAIQEHQVQILPVSPSFLNLLLISGELDQEDFTSLERITYGTEPMPESTLKALNARFPDIICQQTYGLSELGILRTKSLSSDSLWVKVGGEGYETRIVDNKLEIRAEAAMLGYLNAPSPFTADGWFQTGDAVEVQEREDGTYLRILGRQSEQMNVGGEKVYPAEIESVLLELDNVQDAAVYGEPNPILGTMVVAKIVLQQPEGLSDFRKRLRQFCASRIESFKIPQKIVLAEGSLTGDRLKKTRG